jgi:hypothetical protein
MRPLTSEAGVEGHPALSPDGRFLVYAAGPGFYGPRDLFLRSVSEGAPLRLPTSRDEPPPPGRRRRRIAFVRQSAGSPAASWCCPFPRRRAHVGRCAAPATGLAWLASAPSCGRPSGPDEVNRIRALDVSRRGRPRRTRPSRDSLGDSDPLPSRRPAGGLPPIFSNGVQVLYLADARTGAERALTRDGWKAFSYAWAPDGRTLFYTTTAAAISGSGRSTPGGRRSRSG